MERRSPNHFQALKDSQREAAEAENSPPHPDVQHNQTDAAEQTTAQQKIEMARAQYNQERTWVRDEREAGQAGESRSGSEPTQADAPLPMRPEDRKAAQTLHTYEINQRYEAREHAFERFGERLGALVATDQVEYDAAHEAYAQELDKHIESGRGEDRDRSRLFARFDRDCSVDSNIADMRLQRGQESNQSNDAIDRRGNDGDAPRRESTAEKEVKNEAHAHTGRGEMTDAQQERYSRLMMGESFRETAHEVTGQGNDGHNHDGGRERDRGE